MTPEELSDRLVELAVRVGKLCDRLPNSRLGRHVADQLVRSGTSPAPNYEEGCAAESRSDFIHKLRICLKELRESRVWLRVIIKAELISDNEPVTLLNECNELCNIIGQSLVTAKSNATNRSQTR